MHVDTTYAKETACSDSTVMTGVLDLHFKASLLATSSPASMDVQVKHSLCLSFAMESSYTAHNLKKRKR
jgi:hypothetical protein